MLLMEPIVGQLSSEGSVPSMCTGPTSVVVALDTTLYKRVRKVPSGGPVRTKPLHLVVCVSQVRERILIRGYDAESQRLQEASQTEDQIGGNAEMAKDMSKMSPDERAIQIDVMLAELIAIDAEDEALLEDGTPPWTLSLSGGDVAAVPVHDASEYDDFIGRQKEEAEAAMRERMKMVSGMKENAQAKEKRGKEIAEQRKKMKEARAKARRKREGADSDDSMEEEEEEEEDEEQDF